MLPSAMRVAVPAAALAALLTGCVGDQGLNLDLGLNAPAQPGPPLPPAELPVYAKGDAFRFDNGITNHVKGPAGGALAWGIGDTYDYVAEADFTRPRLSWRWEQEDKTTSGEAELVSESGDLWPLRTGNRAEFVYRFVSRNETTGREGDPYIIQYRCEVTGTEQVTVPDGAYDTYRVACDEYWRQRHWQTETWYYAPAVGHVVRHEVRQWLGSNWRTVALTEAGPAPAFLPTDQRERLARAVQTALENNASGDSVEASAGGLSISVTPTATWKTDAGVFCRRYDQSLSARGRTSTQTGMACRTGAGVWATPSA